MSSQQVELTKYDAEIVFWEGKTREQQHQIEFMAQEMARIETQSRLTEEQVSVFMLQKYISFDSLYPKWIIEHLRDQGF